MSFRKIRPSFGESSASTSNPSESTSSDPTRNARNVSKNAPDSSSGASKRRRVPESVTRNACINCKKARAKCDGKTPCMRCSTRQESSPCIYETHIKHAKEELVKEIKELRAKDHLTEQILGALSTDEQVPGILQRLKNGETYDSIVDWLGRAPYEVLSPRISQRSTNFETSDHEMSGASLFRWTAVTSDSGVLDHLFQLYFAWIHPVHTLFSEGYFVDSYKRQSSHFCSSTLVNAMCALACHLHTVEDKDTIDFEQLGVSFSDAVRLTINPDDRSLTTIQAFAVLFLVDCARGRCLRGSTYLEIASVAISNVDYLNVDGWHAVVHHTSRGLRDLNVEWAQVTFHSPTVFKRDLYDPADEDSEALNDAHWYFYRYVEDQCPAWPSLLAITNREKAKLIAIISDVATLLYGTRTQPIEAHQILRQYAKYVSWHDELPSVIGNIDDNSSQALPHVLSLLILYSTSVIQLLRPLLDWDGFPSARIEEVVWTHAQQGLFLLDRHYRTQYTCRYQAVLQMFAVLHICDIITRFFPSKIDDVTKDGPEAIQFGLEALMQSRAGFPIAGILQELLRRTAVECSVPVPRNIDDLMSPPIRFPQQNPIYMIDDFIDACTRPNYTQPATDIQSSFGLKFAADWIAEGPSLGFKAMVDGTSRISRGPWTGESEEERGAQSLMQISNLLNTN